VEIEKYTRDVLAKEIAHRGERREQTFSWASSLLIAIIGGTVALTNQGSLGLGQRGALVAAIMILAGYASGWNYYHWKSEQCARKAIKEYNKALHIPLHINEASKYRVDWWRVTALAGLAVIALGLTVLPLITALFQWLSR
jgi:hypothetical protein